jgi:hypothetical protein
MQDLRGAVAGPLPAAHAVVAGRPLGKCQPAQANPRRQLCPVGRRHVCSCRRAGGMNAADFVGHDCSCHPVL